MNFKIGQKVVCVNARSLNGVPNFLRKDTVYIIAGIQTCHCGRVLLDVGTAADATGYRCFHCKEHVADSDSILWHYCERFAPLLEDEAEEAVTELLKSLNLETA